jgi:hypothetical protein
MNNQDNEKIEFDVWWEEFKSEHDEWTYADSSTLRWRAWQAAREPLLEELAKLKAQEPVCHQYQSKDGTWKGFMDQKHYENTVRDGWPVRALYLAAGAQPTTTAAVMDILCLDSGLQKDVLSQLKRLYPDDVQPVQEGYQLVPVEPTRAMILAYLNAQHDHAMTSSILFGISDPKLNFRAGYKAMLAEAKEAPC